jgi:hypothetical protein
VPYAARHACCAPAVQGRPVHALHAAPRMPHLLRVGLRLLGSGGPGRGAALGARPANAVRVKTPPPVAVVAFSRHDRATMSTAQIEEFLNAASKDGGEGQRGEGGGGGPHACLGGPRSVAWGIPPTPGWMGPWTGWQLQYNPER